MIKPIMRDVLFLAKPSEPATPEDMQFSRQKRKFTGWTAQIIQHECDHLEGIII